ncbi:MAG: M67 family metallopeptidase [Butyrivibrio sp.]|nr:M67 family metallopeptidase [Butyrivibrio sp.]
MNEEFILFNEAYREIKHRALMQYPNEACGLLLSRWSDHAIEIASVADNKADGEEKAGYFKIDPIQLYEMEREIEEKGYEVIGFFHSHPDKQAVLSYADNKNMIPGMVYIIVSVTEDTVHDLRGYMKDTPEGDVYEIRIEEESIL